MSKIYFKRIAKLCISLFMIAVGVITFISFNSYNVYASSSQNARKTDYKTTDKKPTYTETLNANNEYFNNLQVTQEITNFLLEANFSELEEISSKLEETNNNLNRIDGEINTFYEIMDMSLNDVKEISKLNEQKADANNALLNELLSRTKSKEEQAKEKEIAKDNKRKENLKNYSKNIANDILYYAKTMKDSFEGKDVDKAVFAYQLLKRMTTMVASVYGYGAIAEAAFSLIEGFSAMCSYGESAPTELQCLKEEMLNQFLQVKDEIYYVENQISNLSLEVNRNIDRNFTKLANVSNALQSRNRLEKFMTRGDGNFSYEAFKNYLYGSTDASSNKAFEEAYFNLLNESIIMNRSEDVIKLYYDELFSHLLNNIHIFDNYITGSSSIAKPICQEYYDFVRYNQTNSIYSPEYDAVQFAADIYQTYSYSYDALRQCLYYQKLSLEYDANWNGLSAAQLNDSFYCYGGSNYITYDNICKMLESIDNYEEGIKGQIVQDLNYILSLDGSYLISYSENGKIEYHDVYTYGSNAQKYVNAIPEENIYFNILDERIKSIFKLESSDFSFYFDDNKTSLKDMGYLNSEKINNYSKASLYYKDTLVYQLGIVSDRPDTFSGGEGTLDRPYLIANKNDFKLMYHQLFDSKDPEVYKTCYKLVKDIDLTDEVFYSMGSLNYCFNGVFDGGNHVIKNLSIQSAPRHDKNQTENQYTGLFSVIGEKGIVKSIQFENIKVESNYNKDSFDPKNDLSLYYIGTVTGYNKGIIDNISITNDINTTSIDVYRNKTVNEDRNVYVLVGGITGQNENLVSNCRISGLSFKVHSENDIHNRNESNNVNNVYCGGINGLNSGYVEKSRITNSKMDVKITSKGCKDNDTLSPDATIAFGGINGGGSFNNEADNETRFNIKQCFAEVNYSYSFDFNNSGKPDWFHAFRAPYNYNNSTCYSGKYAPSWFYISSDTKLSDFEFNRLQPMYDIYKEQYHRIQMAYSVNGDLSSIDLSIYPHWDSQEVDTYCEEDFIAYYKAQGKAKELEYLTSHNCEVVDSYYDSIFTTENNNYSYVMKYNGINDSDNESLEYKTYLPDEYLSTDNMEFYIIKSDGTETLLDARVVATYGYSSKRNASDLTRTTVQIRLFIEALYEEETLLFYYDTKVYIEGYTLQSLDLPDYVPHTYALTDDSIDNQIEYVVNNLEESILSKKPSLELTYNSGYTRFVSSYTIKKIDAISTELSEEGKLSVLCLIYFTGYDFPVKKIVEISCNHVYSDEMEHDVSCQELAYTYKVCSRCGFEDRYNFRPGSHQFEDTHNIEVTCDVDGIIGEIKCKKCNKVFKEGEVIKALGHKYVKFDGVIDGHSSNDYHYCLQGKHYDLHEFTVTEGVTVDGKMQYTYKCSCGYTKIIIDDNIINENSNIPTIYVTDGYFVNYGDQVVVYVQLLNSTGFNAASFGIRYSDGLRLVKEPEKAKGLPQTISESQEVYNGYNFLWSSTSISNPNGYLLKLTFEVVDLNDDFEVKVIYGLENKDNVITTQGFEDASGLHQYPTRTGKIKKVDHLPGDVNSDGIVDIMDATYIAWYCIKKIKTPTDPEELANFKYNFSLRYADVNLNNEVNVEDVTIILMSIYGVGGKSIINYEYYLHLNLNGYENDEIKTNYEISYYDEDGKINNWNLPQSLNTLEREGYTFLGWYTKLYGGEKVDLDGKIKYFSYQKSQTLYAIWQLNQVVYSIDGITKTEKYQPGLDEENIIYLPDGLEHRYKVYFNAEIEYWDPANKSFETEKSKHLVDWVLGDTHFALGQSIDLRTPNTNLSLTEIWTDYIIESYPPENDLQISNHYEVDKWYTDSAYQVALTDNVIQRDEDLYLYTKISPYKYKLVYHYRDNGDGDYITDSTTFSYYGTWPTLKELSYRDPEDRFYIWKTKNGIEVTNENLRSLLLSCERDEDKVYVLDLYEVQFFPTYTIYIKGPNFDKLYSDDFYNPTIINTIYYQKANGYFYDKECTMPITNMDYDAYQGFINLGLFYGEVVGNATNEPKISNQIISSSNSSSLTTQVFNSNGELVGTPSLSNQTMEGYLTLVLKAKEVTLKFNSSQLINGLPSKDIKGSDGAFSYEYVVAENKFVFFTYASDAKWLTNYTVTLKANTRYELSATVNLSTNIQLVTSGGNVSYEFTLSSSNNKVYFTTTSSDTYRIRFTASTLYSNITVKNLFLKDAAQLINGLNSDTSGSGSGLGYSYKVSDNTFSFVGYSSSGEYNSSYTVYLDANNTYELYGIASNSIGIQLKSSDGRVAYEYQLSPTTSSISFTVKSSGPYKITFKGTTSGAFTLKDLAICKNNDRVVQRDITVYYHQKLVLPNLLQYSNNAYFGYTLNGQLKFDSNGKYINTYFDLYEKDSYTFDLGVYKFK